VKTCFNTATSEKYPLKDTVDYLAKYGYEAIEIATDRLDEDLAGRSLADLKGQLNGCGVEVAALMAFCFDPFGAYAGEIQRIGKYGPIAVELGASVLLTFCACGFPEGVSRDEANRRAGEVAAEYGEAAAKFGLRIALEPIGGTEFMPGPKEALRVARASRRDNVGMMMDTFHYYKSRVPMSDIRAIPRDALLIVHVNDCLQLPPEKLRDSHRVYPGQGVMPLREYLSVLKNDVGYDGFISVEIFNPAYWEDDHENIVKFSKAALEKVLAEI
jgi:2-keto-myo-inositol isomerase